MKTTTLTAFLILSVALCDCLTAAPPAKKKRINGPLAPRESLKHLKLAANLKLELIAHEPQVVDPVAIAFDEDRRLWVVEMSDYPNGPGKGKPPRSRVRILEDRDSDGRYETSRVFVDRLLFATGIQLWKGGAFVTLAGKVMYFRDSTGDGRADVKKLWYTGFTQGNQQLRANHPTFGLDNRIYIANGLRGGKIVGHVTGKPGKTVSIASRDFRFNPRDGSYQAIAGQGQFGLTFDDYGNRFVCTNRNPMKHIVLASRYVKRNSFLAIPSLANDISPTGPSATVFPLSRNFTHLSGHAGQITSACGIHYFRGTSLGSSFLNNLFVCEPAGNLIHRRHVEPHGGTFQTRRARERVEFLASPDDWFRPVNLTTGPDGALYVVDMYRAIIEHPHWLPAALANKLPLQAGDDRGRLYRITNKAKCKRPKLEKLSMASSKRLVQLFEHANAWQRTTAARLLYERQDKSAVAHLLPMVKHGKTHLARIHALWALHGLGALTAKTVQSATTDKNGFVREQAVRLSEPWLSDSAPLLAAIQKRATDLDPRVRLQAALSLGEAKLNTGSLRALKEIATNPAADSWATFAVMSSLRDQTTGLLLNLIQSSWKDEAAPTPRMLDLIRQLAEEVGSRRSHKAIPKILDSTIGRTAGTRRDRQPLQMSLLIGLARGVGRGGGTLAAILAGDETAKKRAAKQLDTFMKTISGAARLSSNERLVHQWFDLISALGHRKSDVQLMAIATNSTTRQRVRRRAIEILSPSRHKQLGASLLEGFNSQTPVIRQAVLNTMLAESGRTKQLLDAFGSGKIAISELSPTAVNQLVKHRDSPIQALAKKLLAAAIPAKRQVVLKKYQAVLKLNGVAASGRQIFRKNCATCHQIHGVGVQVGPYIGDFSLRRKPAVVLESILNPNRAIDANYVSYTLVTEDGRTRTGVISSETPTSITFKQAENKVSTVLRSNIQLLRSNRISLMPEGLEKNISIQQMADLMAFLRDWRFADDLVPQGK